MEGKIRSRYPQKVRPDGTFGDYGCVSIVAKVHPVLAKAIFKVLMGIPGLQKYYKLLAADSLHISAMQQAIVKEDDVANLDWSAVLVKRANDFASIATDLVDCPVVIAKITAVNANDNTISIAVAIDAKSKEFAANVASRHNLPVAQAYHITCGYRFFYIPAVDLKNNINQELSSKLGDECSVQCEPFKVYYSDNVNHFTLWDGNKTYGKPQSNCALM